MKRTLPCFRPFDIGARLVPHDHSGVFWSTHAHGRHWVAALAVALLIRELISRICLANWAWDRIVIYFEKMHVYLGK